MKRTVYLEIDEAYIPIFKSCGMMLSYDQFKELIRCKDCMFYGLNPPHNCIVPCNQMPGDGFCSKGKRKENG